MIKRSKWVRSYSQLLPFFQGKVPKAEGLEGRGEAKSFIGAGCSNLICCGTFASIVGGVGNTVSGCHSSILGGQGNKVTHDHAAAFGNGVSSVMACAFHANNFVAQNMPTGTGVLPAGAFWYDPTTCIVHIIP